jgi:hypothetical protein
MWRDNVQRDFKGIMYSEVGPLLGNGKQSANKRGMVFVHGALSNNYTAT